jgi:hypothetical protein
MRNPASLPTEPVYIKMARKFILLILLMVVTALGLVLLLLQMRIPSQLLLQLISSTSMGLIAGLSTRWVLQKKYFFLRIVSLLSFLIAGLELLGWFTGWRVGLGLLKFGFHFVDWYMLGQLLLATGLAFLALYAWALPAPISIRPAPGSASVARAARTALQSKKHLPGALQPPPTKMAEKSVKSKRKRIIRRKPRLQLSKAVEHRCPYCLELIIPDDPRGTVECKICHTLHHADCWAITGACQVPHYTV